ncbi:MAG: peptidoglycan DD-metalloendopeptidase family protein [Flavobacterium sp.]
MKSFANLFSSLAPVHVLKCRTENIQYVSIDLSKNSPFLKHYQLQNATDYESAIESYLQEHNATIAWGGYLEQRNLYQRSPLFQATENPRNIHLGIDLWAPSETSVLAPLDGKIHSFANNDNWGDYGPTIILQHELKGQVLYTLYGHLSLASLENIKEGQSVMAGQNIASLGGSSVNGDYAPHLHFQVILDLQGKKGDYPGVCSATELDFYRNNCPDPNLLLKIL